MAKAVSTFTKDFVSGGACLEQAAKQDIMQHDKRRFILS
jgi:hypothetical protein